MVQCTVLFITLISTRMSMASCDDTLYMAEVILLDPNTEIFQLCSTAMTMTTPNLYLPNQNIIINIIYEP